MKKTLCIIGALLLALPVVAQNPVGPTSFGGRLDALSFAYGGQGQGAALVVGAGGGTGGTSYAVTLDYGKASSAGQGYVFYPFSYALLPSIAIGSGATYEVVTPSSASYTTGQANSYQQCSITAAFTYSHGAGDIVRSGDQGLVEALNFAEYAPSMGNMVELGEKWYMAGGTLAEIQGVTIPYPNVFIEDTSGTSGFRYFSAQPSATTALATPATLVAANITQPTACTAGFGGSTCTWTASQPYFSIAYVDIQGNISVGGTGYQVGSNLTASMPVTIAQPAASAGAVGWLVFAGTTQNLLQYQLPVTTTATGAANGVCTLTTIETVTPACALPNTNYNQAGSGAATFNTIYAATNMLIPVASEATANVWNPVFNAHSSFSYQPTATALSFQTNYTPFSANAATTASGNRAVLATVPLPPGYLNVLGRTIRVKGKYTSTVTSGVTPEILINLGSQGANYGAAGIPATLCTMLSVGTTLAVTTVNGTFECVLTTNAASATAAGTLMPDGWAGWWGTGITGVFQADSGTAAVSSLGLFEPVQLFVTYLSTAQASSAAQVTDLHIETLQ